MSFSPKWAALAVALASIALLVGPASAGAVVTSEVQGSKLTVKGDGQPDAIALTVAGGKIAVNGTPTTLNADANAELVVESGGGNDTVDASGLAAATYKSLLASGGEGNDQITGGAVNGDELKGDAGNDTITGGKGTDTVFGGTEDDVMIWNNGDGSDVNNGEAGNDESVVNGSPAAGDAVTYRPDAVAGRVVFARTNLVPFTVNLEAEHLTVNGEGGDDTMAPDPAALAGLAGRTVLTLNGGDGNDNITGGDGEDVLNGDKGNDMLVGFKGKDTVSGGEGDDVMVWNNGDASDVDNGEAGNDEVVVNGSPAADDADTYKPAEKAGRVLFARTNLVAFTVDFDAEHLTVNGLGGNDTMAPEPAAVTGLGARTTLVLNGGDGNDTIVGADGNDTIVGGAGSDVTDGQDGNDQLMARDQENDLVRGGAGDDSAQTDALTVDSVSGVEHLDATQPPASPPADTVAVLPRVGKTTVARSGRKLLAKVPVSCPAAETGGCRTTLTVETAKAARLGSLHAVVVLGSKTVKLGPGAKMTAAIRLASGASALARNGKLPARIRIASTDAAGNTATRTVTATLKVPGT